MAPNPQTAPIDAEPFSLQYSAETKFIQVHGTPDWAFWTQPSKEKFEFTEGAGRVFGPVDATEFMRRSGDTLDFARIGFPQVAEKDCQLLSAPRVTSRVDGRKRVEAGRVENYATKLVLSSTASPSAPAGGGTKPESGKVTNFAEFFGKMYNDLAVTPKTLTLDDVTGVAIIADVSPRVDELPRNAKPDAEKFRGYMAILEADSTETPGEYQLDLSVLIRTTLSAKNKPGRSPSRLLAHAQFRCSRTLKDGSSAAFLLPVAEDEYLLVLSALTLINPDGSRRFLPNRTK